ncbi:GntR family transcriptional regulator [Streptomyces sp. S3(2020)]|uniref:GntR family transcriptional regulator n=1 Tax=Streptomyces sp. S3(2020) TaxID=2732044 RepID=UPI0014892B8D|nr:GntR family transcriptional regulator [Streptomyces sp. S3(2020)]NNN35021.1 GntR family transcriptional regulator [Streptomyces sp. S3(2020)]
MPGDIVRPSAMYKQLADRLAEAIAAGEYGPGSMLPSETQLMERYQVSRPTVRSAIAELRSMGLVESQHGKGSFVRTHGLPAAVIKRTISRSSKGFALGWPGEEAELPAVTRGEATGITATLLDRDEADVFITDRLLKDPATGARATHRTVIPFDVAEQLPTLAKHPDAEPADIYTALTAAGHTLSWTETVTARNALPDERADLDLTDGSPILITYRVTTTEDGRPLILEELRVSADTAQLAFHITVK